MALNKKISELDPAASLAGNEKVAVVQGGHTLETTTQEIANLLILTTAVIGAGSTNITRAAHLNRALSCNQAGATSQVFAATATSGALDGDGFECLNTGAGTMTASGDITAAAGFKLTAGTGEVLSAIYDETADAFYSTTPDIAGLGSGTVTHTGSLTANALVLGNGTADVKPMGSLGTATTVLHGNAAGAPTYGAVSLTADVTGVLPVANYATGTPTGSKFVRDDGVLATPSGATLLDGDYGDIVVSSSGAAINIDSGVLTAAGRALIDDADATAQRATLGLVIGTNVQAYDADLAAIAGLTSAADKGIQFTGSGTAATYDLTTAGKALLDDADATAQRATLGLVIGTNVQAYDADLGTIAGLTATTDNFIQAKSSAWASRTVAQVSADLQATGLVTDAVGFRTIPQNSQSAAYTTVAADSGKHILHPSSDANARTFTIDSNANVAYPVGTAITFVNQTSQVLSIAITSDTLTLANSTTTGTRALAQNGVATALKITSTIWIISGSGLT